MHKTSTYKYKLFSILRQHFGLIIYTIFHIGHELDRVIALWGEDTRGDVLSSKSRVALKGTDYYLHWWEAERQGVINEEKIIAELMSSNELTLVQVKRIYLSKLKRDITSMLNKPCRMLKSTRTDYKSQAESE